MLYYLCCNTLWNFGILIELQFYTDNKEGCVNSESAYVERRTKMNQNNISIFLVSLHIGMSFRNVNSGQRWDINSILSFSVGRPRFRLFPWWLILWPSSLVPDWLRLPWPISLSDDWLYRWQGWSMFESSYGRGWSGCVIFLADDWIVILKSFMRKW